MLGLVVVGSMVGIRGNVHRRTLPVPSQRRNIRLVPGCQDVQLGADISSWIFAQNRRNLLIPVRIIMCPDVFFRIAGSAALMMLTGPK